MWPDNKQFVYDQLKRIENTSVSTGAETTTIGACCRIVATDSRSLLASTDALTPVLRTALVINWKEAAMKKRYDRFRELFPGVTTLSALKQELDSHNPLDFCHKFLLINANPLCPENNPKYRLLCELTNGFLEYQTQYQLASEIQAIRHWSARVDRSHLEDDFMGKRRGVGPGVVGNIKLNLGERTIKPDRHVIGVLRQFLNVKISFDKFDAFAAELGMDARYLDCLLFEFGKASNIAVDSDWCRDKQKPD